MKKLKIFGLGVALVALGFSMSEIHRNMIERQKEAALERVVEITKDKLLNTHFKVQLAVRKGEMTLDTQRGRLGVDLRTFVNSPGTIYHEIAHIWHTQVIRNGESWVTTTNGKQAYRPCNSDIDCAIREKFKYYRDTRLLSNIFIEEYPGHAKRHPYGTNWGECERLEDFAKRNEVEDADGVKRYYYNGVLDKPMYVYAECHPHEFFAEMSEAYMNMPKVPYYPRNREDLKKLDKELHDIIAEAWGQ